MIVSYFNLVSVVILPAETDAPLVIDTHAPLADAATPEGFQPVARECS